MPDGVLGRYTGANCPPEKRKAIVEHVMNGTPIQEIAETVHASTKTVMVVRDQECPNWKQEQSNGLKRLARSMVNHFNDADLDSIPWTVKPVMYGIVMDKIAQLDGEPTQIVEHRHSVDINGLKSSVLAHDSVDVEVLTDQPVPESSVHDSIVSNPQLPEASE